MVHGDGESLVLGGWLTIRALPYNVQLPEGSCRDTVWLHHEPPEGSPVAMGLSGRSSFGCRSLAGMAAYLPEELPPLVISGHQHSPFDWRWNSSGTLFLNSGQKETGKAPHHLVIEIEADRAVVAHNGQAPGITHSLRRCDHDLRNPFISGNNI
jgi:hypothetical protein